MKFFLFTALSLSIISCDARKLVHTPPPGDTLVKLTAEGNYELLKQQVHARRQKFYQQYIAASNESKRGKILDSAGRYLEEFIVNKLIPHWYGTTWSFEGHSNEPGKGEIACGYFVSTLLSHSGLKVNRYKLAQQNPLNEVKTLHQAEVIAFNTESSPALRDSIYITLKDGLYILGLRNHVGFVLKRKESVYFIHSDYFHGAVNIENLSYSPAALQGAPYLLGAISTNRALIRQWLFSSPVKIVSQ